MTRIVHILLSAMTVLSASLCGIALWFWMQGQWVIDYDLWNSSWSLDMRHGDPTHFQIDWWYVIIPAAILPMIRLCWARFTEIPSRAYCAACGYDLRATPERCPECGTAVVSKPGPPSEGKGETEGV